jgi:phospholipid/cholesterol/gamma-HCH transport system ATP-binding protein
MRLGKGENIAVLGKSGSGKSVLIKCIVRLVDAEQGSIRVLNEEVQDLSNEELDAIRSKIGFLFQSNALYDSMTVRENLEFPLRRHRVEKELVPEEVEKLVREVLHNVGLEHTIDMMPSGECANELRWPEHLFYGPKLFYMMNQQLAWIPLLPEKSAS